MRRFIFAALRVVGALDQRLRERLTLAGWLVLGAAGSAAAAGLDTNLTVTYRAFAFLAALLALSWLASLFFRARIEASREMPRYATAGEPFSYRINLANRGARTLAGVLVTERFRDPRPSFDEWKRAREPGEEQRNWFDRTVGYFRWRWLIERRVPRELEPAALAPLDGSPRRAASRPALGSSSPDRDGAAKPRRHRAPEIAARGRPFAPASMPAPVARGTAMGHGRPHHAMLQTWLGRWIWTSRSK